MFSVLEKHGSCIKLPCSFDGFTGVVLDSERLLVFEERELQLSC
jgi:hypothetical protein